MPLRFLFIEFWVQFSGRYISSDLSQNLFLIGKFIAETEKDVTKEKGKALFKQFNLYSSFNLIFLA